MSENKPKLLVIFHEEIIYDFLVDTTDKNYDLFIKSHGCLVNSNDGEFNEDVVNFLSEEIYKYINRDLDVYTLAPKNLSGNYKVIHCGFIL